MDPQRPVKFWHSYSFPQEREGFRTVESTGKSMTKENKTQSSPLGFEYQTLILGIM